MYDFNLKILTETYIGYIYSICHYSNRAVLYNIHPFKFQMITRLEFVPLPIYFEHSYISRIFDHVPHFSQAHDVISYVRWYEMIYVSVRAER